MVRGWWAEHVGPNGEEMGKDTGTEGDSSKDCMWRCNSQNILINGFALPPGLCKVHLLHPRTNRAFGHRVVIALPTRDLYTVHDLPYIRWSGFLWIHL